MTKHATFHPLRTRTTEAVTRRREQPAEAINQHRPVRAHAPWPAPPNRRSKQPGTLLDAIAEELVYYHGGSLDDHREHARHLLARSLRDFDNPSGRSGRPA